MRIVEKLVRGRARGRARRKGCMLAVFHTVGLLPDLEDLAPIAGCRGFGGGTGGRVMRLQGLPWYVLRAGLQLFCTVRQNINRGCNAYP